MERVLTPLQLISDAGTIITCTVFFSERELYLLSPVRLSVVCLSVTLVRPTQAVEIFGNISMALGTLAIH